MGLLLAHKRTLRIYSDMFTLTKTNTGDRVGGGKRGGISVFSNDSRFRLFRLLHKLRFDKVTFCTLTYPAVYPNDAKVYKAHLKEYRRRFERKYGKIQAVWRLEFQKRGAPHYHIMYLDCPFIPVSDWCKLWHDVTGSNDVSHETIGVDVKLVTTGKEKKLVASYLGKYIAKVDERKQKETKAGAGRWWGKWNVTEDIPIEVELLDYQAERLVADVLDAQGGSWLPMDPTICTVLGATMGREDFRLGVIKAVKNVIHL